MSELDAPAVVADIKAQILQTVVELDRGVTILEHELEVWAKINTAHGRHEIAETIANIREIVQLQDILMAAIRA